MRFASRIKERLDPQGYTSWKDICIYLGRYAFAANFVEQKTVLDIACGTGFGSNYLLKKGAKSVTGSDISKDAINYAQTRYMKKGLTFAMTDAQRMVFSDNSFDVIISMETIEHLPNYQSYLSECSRILRTGGYFICSTPNKAVSFSENPKPFHEKEFTSNELFQEISQYFTDVRLLGYIQYNSGGIKQKIINAPISVAYHSPERFQSAVLNFVRFITRFAFHDFYPTSLEEVDERDFGQIISNGYKPFDMEHGEPEYLIAIGKKAPKEKN